MEMTVEAMLKLIEEDADSFARRAEMYYKKRPELKKLVDEFYRGYRALAERYEHSTRALHHAHRTMAEAFPNQIPPLLSDEYGSSFAEVESHKPKMILPARSLFDSDGTKKGALRRRHDLYTEGSDSSLSSKKGLKQYSEMLATGEGETRPNSSEGKVRKGVQLSEEESKFAEDKALNQDQEVEVKSEAKNVTTKLQNDILQLSARIHTLKDQIMEESKRANNAESEVQSLKGTLSKLSSEKDEALLQYQVSLEKLSSLETLLSHTQYALEKTNDDMAKEIRKLKTAEQLNQSLQLGLDTLEQKAKMQEHEINQKQEELEKLQTTVQEKYRQFLEAEMALVLSEKRYIQSQEDAKILDLEIQKGIENLKIVEKCNMGLEAGMRKLKEENSSLNEQNLHFTLLIKDLQGEITLLKENKTKFEDELRLLLKEKEVLSQELYHVKEEKNELERRCHDLLEKMQAVSKCAESLQTATEDLKNGNCLLKEVCKKHEAEKELLMEKNVILQRFLSNANVDVEILREKAVVLESTQDSLKSKISLYISERDSLASQLKILTENKAALSAKNTLLENSLFDASREVESLRSKAKNLEESCQSLDNQNSGLLAEKYALVSRVESISTNLENLESRYAEVMAKYLNLSGERDLMINQVKELEDILKIEKQQHEACMQSYENLLTTSENRISLLQEENQYKDKELQTEVHNLIDALIENFILRRSLIDLKERNLVLSLEGRRYLEACRSAETLVSKLEQEKIIQMRNTTALTKHKEKLSERIHLLCKVLNLDKGFRSVEEIQEEVLLEIILNEMKKLMNSFAEVEDNNHQLQLEISVIATLVRHIGIDVINLSLQKYSLQRELENTNDKLVAYGNEKHELLARNGQLVRDIEAANQREEVLKNEIKVLYMQLTHVQEVLQTKQWEITKLIEERKSLSQETFDLRQQFSILEDEHIEVLLQAMNLDHLYLFFESLNADRVMELKSLGYDLDALHVIKKTLASEVDGLKGKLSLLEVEKTYLSNSVTCLEEELRNRLLILEFDLNFVTRSFEEQNLQIETINNDLIEKEAQPSEANQKVQSTEEKNVKLKRLIEAFPLDIEETKMDKEKMEKKNLNLSQDICDRNEEIRCLCEENKMLQRDIDEIHKRAEVLMRREDFLISELQKQTNEIVDCEGEIAVMLNDIQFLTVNGALLDEKVHELIVEDELSAIVEKEILVVEISSSRGYIEELKHELHELEGENKGLKTDLDVHLLMLKSLWDGVVSMEGQIMSISKHALVNNRPKEHGFPLSQKHWSTNQPTENHRGGKTAGVLLLEKLNNKVESLQELIIYNMSLFEQERLDSIASLDSGRKEVEISKTNFLPEIDVSSKQFDVTDGKGDAEHCKEKYEEMTKDIQLDQVSSSLPLVDVGSHGPSIGTPGIDEQSLESFERSCDNQTCETSATTSGNGIQSTKDEEWYHVSSTRLTEEPSTDKLDVHQKPSETKHDWKKRVLKRLNSATQRLSDLRNSIEDLKKMMNSQSDKPSMIYGFGSIKEQLEETEGAMLELIEANTRLKNMAEDYTSLDGTTIKPEDRGSIGRRQISEQTRLGSENITTLEFKLQKIQYVLMKIVEEHEDRKHKATRRNRVVLSDYLYGKRHNHPHRSSLCDCMRLKAESDS